jgi:hypothetical protein
MTEERLGTDRKSLICGGNRPYEQMATYQTQTFQGLSQLTQVMGQVAQQSLQTQQNLDRLTVRIDRLTGAGGQLWPQPVNGTIASLTTCCGGMDSYPPMTMRIERYHHALRAWFHSPHLNCQGSV